jgi:hypothetical protein
MADVTTGGLDSAEEPVIKETRPKTGGLSIAGAKGVSLEPENSLEVRNRLLELIRQRESERSGFGALLEKLAVYSPSQNTSLNERMSGYAEKQRQRDQDIFNMQLGVSQLDTEEKRLAQARADAIKNREQFNLLLTGGAGGAGGTSVPTAPPAGGEGGGPIASPQQMQAFAQNLNRDQAVALMMLYKQNPTEATKQLIQLTKLTDSQREAREAGLIPGTTEYQTFMRLKLAGSGAFTPHDVRTPEGTIERTPLDAARPGGALPVTARPVPVPAPAPAPTESTPGSLPTSTTVTPRVVLPELAPAPVRPATATTTTTATTGFKPGSKEDLAARQKQAEAQIALEQKRQEVPIEGAKTEAQDIGKASAADQVVHSDNVKMAPANALISKQLETDINAVPGLLGKLNKPTIFSTIMNLADKGVQVGNLGSVSIPGLKDAIVQLDPEVRKDPKKLEAYQRVINNISKIGLEFARAVNKGMGSMSNYERSIVEQAVGDPTRMNANNLMMKAKALECDAKNAMEKDKLWNQMQKAGYDWTKFKKSPEYIDMERKQFYRTAKAMRLPDAKFPGDQ